MKKNVFFMLGAMLVLLLFIAGCNTENRTGQAVRRYAELAGNYTNTTTQTTGTTSVNTNPPGPTPGTPYCRDSDGGPNANVQGFTDGRVNGVGPYFSDVCRASDGKPCTGSACTVLVEGYCGPNGVASTNIKCQYGCANGTCKAAPAGKGSMTVCAYNDTMWHTVKGINASIYMRSIEYNDYKIAASGTNCVAFNGIPTGTYYVQVGVGKPGQQTTYLTYENNSVNVTSNANIRVNAVMPLCRSASGWRCSAAGNWAGYMLPDCSWNESMWISCPNGCTKGVCNGPLADGSIDVYVYDPTGVGLNNTFVSLDGANRRNVNFTTIYANVTPGVHSVYVNKSGYINYTNFSVILASGARTSVRAVLSCPAGNVCKGNYLGYQASTCVWTNQTYCASGCSNGACKVNTTNTTGNITVYVQDETRNLLSGYSVNLDDGNYRFSNTFSPVIYSGVAAGTHKISVYKSFYDSYVNSSVRVLGGNMTTLYATLQTQYASLIVNVYNTSGAPLNGINVTLDENEPVYSSNYSVVFMTIHAGNHSIYVFKDGYRDFVALNVSLPGHETTNFTAVLTKI